MRNWLNSNWLDLLISVLIAIAEAAMIAPWLALAAVWFGAGDLNPAIPIGAGLLGLAFYWTARELLQQQWDIAAMRMVSLGVWIFGVMLWYSIVAGAGVLGPIRFIDNLFQFQGLAFGLLVLGGLAWWRGLMLGSTGDMLTPEFTRFAVVRTVISLVVVLLFAFFGSDQLATAVFATAAIAVPVGLASSLIAASAMQVRESKERVRSAGDHRGPGAGWLGAGSGIAAGILILAAIIAGTADRAVWSIVFWPIVQILRGVEFILQWVIYGIAWVTFMILTPLFWLIERFVADPDPDRPLIDPPAMPGDAETTTGGGDILPVFVMQILQWSLVMLIVVAVIWFALRQLRRYQHLARKRTDDEVRESLWSRETVMKDLSGIVGGLRPRWGRSRSGIDLTQPPTTVRDAYRYTLVHASRSGIPRRPEETPLHYAERLGEGRGAIQEPLDDLTDRYLRARYGERTTHDDDERARVDWEAIRNRLASNTER